MQKRIKTGLKVKESQSKSRGEVFSQATESLLSHHTKTINWSWDAFFTAPQGLLALEEREYENASYLPLMKFFEKRFTKLDGSCIESPVNIDK